MRKLLYLPDAMFRVFVLLVLFSPSIIIGTIRALAAPEANVPAPAPNLGNWTTPCVTAATVQSSVGVNLGSPDYVGVAMNGDPLLIYVAPNASFGVLVNVAPGIYCILATGDHFTKHP